jgi:hypothetical protein
MRLLCLLTFQQPLVRFAQGAQLVDRPRAEFGGRLLATQFEYREERADFFAKLRVGRQTTVASCRLPVAS